MTNTNRCGQTQVKERCGEYGDDVLSVQLAKRASKNVKKYYYK
jgi:hypothetical protein